MSNPVESTRKWRALKACAIVLAVICAVPGVEALLSYVHQDVKAPAQTSLQVGNALRGADAFSALEGVEDAMAEADASLCAALPDEVVVLPGATDLRVDDVTGVIGYTVKGQADDILSMLESLMERKGWAAVPLGEACGSTFLKEGGDKHWVLATCTQVSSSTCVVMRCEPTRS